MSNELLENNLNNINMQNGSTITRTKIKLFNGKGNKAIGIFATADDFSNGMVTVDELIKDLESGIELQGKISDKDCKYVISVKIDDIIIGWMNHPVKDHSFDDSDVDKLKKAIESKKHRWEEVQSGAVKRAWLKARREALR